MLEELKDALTSEDARYSKHFVEWVYILASSGEFDGEGYRLDLGMGASVRRLEGGVGRWNTNGAYSVEGGLYDTKGERQATPPGLFWAVVELATWLTSVDLELEDKAEAGDG